LIQYRLWRTPSQPPSHPAAQPASHVAVAITLNAKASSLKMLQIVNPVMCYKCCCTSISHITTQYRYLWQLGLSVSKWSVLTKLPGCPCAEMSRLYGHIDHPATACRLSPCRVQSARDEIDMHHPIKQQTNANSTSHESQINILNIRCK